jgi:hypothetical protein
MRGAGVSGAAVLGVCQWTVRIFPAQTSGSGGREAKYTDSHLLVVLPGWRQREQLTTKPRLPRPEQHGVLGSSGIKTGRQAHRCRSKFDRDTSPGAWGPGIDTRLQGGSDGASGVSSIRDIRLQ